MENNTMYNNNKGKNSYKLIIAQNNKKTKYKKNNKKQQPKPNPQYINSGNVFLYSSILCTMFAAFIWVGSEFKKMAKMEFYYFFADTFNRILIIFEIFAIQNSILAVKI